MFKLYKNGRHERKAYQIAKFDSIRPYPEMDKGVYQIKIDGHLPIMFKSRTSNINAGDYIVAGEKGIIHYPAKLFKNYSLAE